MLFQSHIKFDSEVKTCNAHVATMSKLRAAPRQGHIDRLKSIYARAIRTKDYAVTCRTDQPGYSFLPEQDFDWTW